MKSFLRFGFLLAYLTALTLFTVGTFGLLGAEKDPLSGIFLIPLGFPWIILVEFAPEPFWPWLAALAPSLNLLAIWLFTNPTDDKPGDHI
ncbi:MAG: hypothetical protein ABJ056_14195 [Halioglobus sp.]